MIVITNKKGFISDREVQNMLKNVLYANILQKLSLQEEAVNLHVRKSAPCIPRAVRPLQLYLVSRLLVMLQPAPYVALA